LIRQIRRAGAAVALAVVDAVVIEGIPRESGLLPLSRHPS
jgi:hypothetical protein